MRLRIHAATANEELVGLINEGYDAIRTLESSYKQKKESGEYNDATDVDGLITPVQTWADKVEESLNRIFPTKLESNLFANPDIPLGMASGDVNFHGILRRCHYFVKGLNKIRLQSLPAYTDLPLDARLYVEDIDSFRKVRDVNPSMVLDVLKNGYFDRSEDSIQLAFEKILSVPFHKKDWGGEACSSKVTFARPT